MDNANMPAMPCDMIDDRVSGGITKQEYACIHLCVPETGDPELDAIITKARDTKIAAMTLQGLCAKSGDYYLAQSIAKDAVVYADTLLAELEKTQ